MTTEVKWFIGAALILLAALFIQSGLLAYAMYVLLGMMLLSRLLARDWLGKVVAERSCDTREAEIGDEFPVDVTVRNTGKLPIPWVLIEDLLPREALAQRPPRLKVVKGRRLRIGLLRGGQELAVRYRLQCLTRGYYQIGPLLLESGDLFGLHRRHRVETEPAFVTVYPKVVHLTGYDISSRRPIGDVRLMLKLFEDPTRIAGVRPYELGDPLNRLHWRATARTGELHSKIYEPTSLAGATILLDFHQDGYLRRNASGPQGTSEFRSELAITTAASLAYAVVALSQPAGLCSNGRDAADRIKLERLQKKTARDYRTRRAARSASEMNDASDRLRPVVVPTRRGTEQFQYVREALARLELSDGLAFPQFLLEVVAHLPRDATVIAVLPRVTVETAVALGTLRHQGFAVTAVLVLVEADRLNKEFGLLHAQGVRDVRHVTDEQTLSDLCNRQMVRGGVFDYAFE